MLKNSPIPEVEHINAIRKGWRGEGGRKSIRKKHGISFLRASITIINNQGKSGAPYRNPQEL
jgi:hypothetical protein